MSALPDNIVQFKLPKKPRIKEKEPLPDQRKVAVLPIRALTDQRVSDKMFRVLALVCSYANRAGITWVSQARLAKDAGVTRQAVGRQLVKLRALGYIETVSKAWKGVKPDTVRVVFDPNIDAETAIAVTSRIEDTRPPEMKQKQQEEIDNTIDPEGLRRIHDMIRGVVKPMNQPPKEYAMPKSGDTVTVAKMKADIAAHKAKKARTYATQEVANESPQSAQKRGTHRQHDRQHNEVALNTEITLSNEYIKVLDKHKIKGLNKEEILRLTSVQQLTHEQLDADIAMLLNLYHAEGLPIPQPGMLIDSIMQLHKDAGAIGDAI